MGSVTERNVYMIESVDLSNPVYNGVNISIRKPEVNAGKTTNPNEKNNDNGIYNAVRIDIDNPSVNTQAKKIYDYSKSENIVTYDMLNLNPKQKNEQIEDCNDFEEIPVDDSSASDVNPENNKSEQKNVSKEKLESLLTYNVNGEEIKNTASAELPAPNYVTLETDKSYVENPADDEKTEEVSSKLSFRGDESGIKRPEIIPSENILPKVDIENITDNLSSSNKDIQAQQIEEIVRTSIMDKEKAKNYLVSDVFTELIKITEEDATKLAPPTKQQVDVRKKLIRNILAVEKDRNAINNLPYKLSDEEIALATNLSPMELTERNKEYAITALGVLAELFIEDYESKEGNIVPITDAPGVSAIVNALRRDPDPSVKLAAIDALRQIQRPEYKEELSAILELAKNDPNPNVSRAAIISLQTINN